jgi:hypothetical protein
MNQSVNQFTELNTDMHGLNTKSNVMTDAVNAALTTKGENQLILQNMHGNEYTATLTEGYVPLGVNVFNDISYIVSGKFDADGVFISGEIGTYPSPDWGGLLGQPTLDPDFFLPLVEAYQPLYNFSTSVVPSVLDDDIYYTEPFRTAKLNLLAGNLIEMELQPSYDDSVNIILTEDYNPIRLINSRFKLDDSGKSAAIADRRQTKDTNTYSNTRFGSTRLLKQSDLIPDLQFLGVTTGGSVSGGGYRFYFRYTDSDGALTDVVEESRLVSVAYNDHGADQDENVGRAIKFRLSNLDRKFSGVKVYYAYAAGDTAATPVMYEIVNLFDITGDSIDITIYGTEVTSLYTKDQLNLDYSSIDKVKTFTQSSGRLLIGNITNINNNFDILRDISQTLQLKEVDSNMEIKTLGSGYANPENVYHQLGFWAGETYEVGIVFILTDGQGVTPVFPIRGGDNYQGNFNYSGTPNITSADGFLSPNSSENRLGVYRTNKKKDLLTGSNASETLVRGFEVDITTIKNDAYVQANTQGFFFVRKPRKRDCIVQGFITNTCKESINQKLVTTGNINRNSGAIWGNSKNIQDIRVGIGNKVDISNKILPAPGRIWETTVGDSALINAPVGYPLNIQGKVIPDPEDTTSEMHYAFYAADQLADAPLIASTFNNSSKGIMITNSPVEAEQFLLPHTVTPTTGTNNVTVYNASFTTESLPLSNPAGPADSYGVLVNPGGIANQSIGPITLNVNPTTNELEGSFYMIIYYSGAAGTSPVNQYVSSVVQCNITIDSLGNVNGSFTGTVSQVIGHWISQGGLISGTMDFLNGASVLGSYNYNLTFSNFETVVSSSFAGTTTTIVYPQPGFNETGTYFYTSSNITSVQFLLSTSSVSPIKDLTLRNYSSDPINLSVNTDRRNLLQYIGYGQEAYASNQFSAVSDRNLYYVVRSAQSGGVDLPWPGGKPTTITGTSNLVGVTNNQFAEYVGIRMTKFDSNLTSILRNDDQAVFNLGGVNGYGLTNSNDKDYTWAVQDRGVRLAALANIYTNDGGAMDTGTWRNVYTNSTSGDSYFAISKRYSWAEVANMSDISLHDGDCYVGHIYKRIMYGLGIPGIPTATDPSIYDIGNRATGLYPKGFVMPIVSENNYNVSLRSFWDVDTVETGIYGKGRTFYPIDEIDTLRASRQQESTRYNHGYDYDNSEKVHFVLNDRAPSLNINYGNRILVSAPAVSGNFSNGYTDFSGLNFRDYNKQLGEITRLITHNDYVYCIFRTGIGVVPIDQRTMVTPETGGVFIDDAAVLAQKMQMISTEYGSDQQFSVIKTDSAVYGVDLSKNKVWRISSPGGNHKLDLISDFAVQSILNQFKNRLLSNNLNILVKSNYDRERNNVIFTYFSEENGVFNTDIYETITVPVDPTPNLCDPLDMMLTSPIPGVPSKYVNSQGDINEACCTIVKGYWDPTQSACFVDPLPGGGILTDPSISTDEDAYVERFASNINQPSKDLISGDINNDLQTPVEGPGSSADRIIPTSLVDKDGNLVAQFLKKNNIGSLYWNETLEKWVSRLSWNPLWTFNLQSNLLSFSGTTQQSKIWKHFSATVPFCHFYGSQDKFIFEFVIVDNSSAQKILENLLVISNRAFPGRITYKLLESDFDFELQNSFTGGTNNGYTESLKQRHETTHISNLGNGSTNDWSVDDVTTIGGVSAFTMTATNGDPISEEEANRLSGGFVISAGIIYIIGGVIENSGVFYNEILDQNGINIIGIVPTGWDFSVIDFGIIKQNMEYIEDHLYIEVGRDESKSHIRDKAITVRFMYEGYDYVTIQSVISKFVYSFG